jgi:hypothetical protein
MSVAENGRFNPTEGSGLGAVGVSLLPHALAVRAATETTMTLNKRIYLINNISR